MQDAAMRSRLKIPMFFAYDTVHGERTIFPIGLGMAATWDMDAVIRSAAPPPSKPRPTPWT